LQQLCADVIWSRCQQTAGSQKWLPVPTAELFALTGTAAVHSAAKILSSETVQQPCVHQWPPPPPPPTVCLRLLERHPAGHEEWFHWLNCDPVLAVAEVGCLLVADLGVGGRHHLTLWQNNYSETA